MATLKALANQSHTTTATANPRREDSKVVSHHTTIEAEATTIHRTSLSALYQTKVKERPEGQVRILEAIQAETDSQNLREPNLKEDKNQETRKTNTNANQLLPEVVATSLTAEVVDQVEEVIEQHCNN